MACEVGRSSVPLFALIIGIDNYANCGKLGAAVTDANAIKQYLEEDLQVSKDHITTLFDEEATRDAIIAAFRALQFDKRIEKGDPIVIYYSGHGIERPAPHAWGVDSEIQCLLPQDYEAEDTEPIPDHAPIPDRTIGALIEDIAKEKGDNITVIFDCCHSASGTRGLDDDLDDEYIPRTVHLNINIPETLDDHIWRSRDVSIAKGFAYHGLKSHVLLAACGEKESAYERRGRGLFTTALLKTLRSCDINDLTYAGLLERIKLKPQNPQCEGENRHRVLFDRRVSGKQVYHGVQAKGGKYVLNVGLAHGISRGVQVTLYNNQRVALDAVMVDEAASIGDFETTVTTSKSLGNVSFARLTRVGKIPVYVDPRGRLFSTLNKELTLARAYANGMDAQTFRLVEAEDAKLEVAMKNDGVIFKVLDERVKRFKLVELPHKITLDSVARVLGSAAHYFWFLDLAKDHGRTGTKLEVAVDFYRLKVDYDDYGDPFLSPNEPGFWRKDPISCDNSDEVNVIAADDAYYGMKITNRTPWNLYLNLFMFNNSSLSITRYYTQSSAGKPEVPLKQGGTFTVGYGNGTLPFSFALEADQDVDVSFLKIFFATRPIDLSDVAQPSPLEGVDARDTQARGVWEVANAASKFLSLLYEKHTWFTLEIPVVQRRNAVV